MKITPDGWTHLSYIGYCISGNFGEHYNSIGYQTKRVLLVIRQKQPYWLSDKKGLTGYQTKMSLLIIRLEGSYWL